MLYSSRNKEPGHWHALEVVMKEQSVLEKESVNKHYFLKLTIVLDWCNHSTPRHIKKKKFSCDSAPSIDFLLYNNGVVLEAQVLKTKIVWLQWSSSWVALVYTLKSHNNMHIYRFVQLANDTPQTQWKGPCLFQDFTSIQMWTSYPKFAWSIGIHCSLFYNVCSISYIINCKWQVL